MMWGTVYGVTFWSALLTVGTACYWIGRGVGERREHRRRAAVERAKDEALRRSLDVRHSGRRVYPERQP